MLIPADPRHYRHLSKRPANVLLLSIFCVTAALGGSCRARGPRLLQYEFTGPTMGTTYNVKVVSPGPLIAQDEQGRIENAVQDELDRVNGMMSTFQPDSELSRFNQSVETTPFAVSPETAEVFAMARSVSEATNGAFDVTVGPLVNAWGFGPDASAPQGPTDSELAALRERVGYEKVKVDCQASTLQKSRPDVYCDLAAIAKGYAVDNVAQRLDALGYTDYMVEVGGEVRTHGRNAKGVAWQIGIERPVPGIPQGAVIERAIGLDNASLATSGDYRNYYERDGKRYSHLIDPHTGRPITHNLASVSVITTKCVDADAFATGLIVLGPDEGYAAAIENDLAALFVIRDDSGGYIEKATPKFEALLKSGAK